MYTAGELNNSVPKKKISEMSAPKNPMPKPVAWGDNAVKSMARPVTKFMETATDTKSDFKPSKEWEKENKTAGALLPALLPAMLAGGGAAAMLMGRQKILGKLTGGRGAPPPMPKAQVVGMGGASGMGRPVPSGFRRRK